MLKKVKKKLKKKNYKNLPKYIKKIKYKNKLIILVKPFFNFV